MCSVRLLTCKVTACCLGERINTPSRTAKTGCSLGLQASAPSFLAGQAPGRMSWPWWPNPLEHWPTSKLRASQKLSRQGYVAPGLSDLSLDERRPKDCEC